MEDQAVIDAIALRLAAMIDALRRLPDSIRDACFGQTWRYIWGMRNRIVHGYMGVDPDIVRATVLDDLDEVEQNILDCLRNSAQHK